MPSLLTSNSFDQQSPKWSNKKMFPFCTSDELCKLRLVSRKRMSGGNAVHMQKAEKRAMMRIKAFVHRQRICFSQHLLCLCAHSICILLSSSSLLYDAKECGVMNTSCVQYMVFPLFNKRFSIVASSWYSCTSSYVAIHLDTCPFTTTSFQVNYLNLFDEGYWTLREYFPIRYTHTSLLPNRGRRKTKDRQVHCAFHSMIANVICCEWYMKLIDVHDLSM